ncbi:unnamed protein product [Adineta ricciae]|uniref:Pentapeptide repeat-containing protein n=2 Tax=Adineta ricciae TaxID=249248 RepID=A0A815NCI8_ADIRI|nr:unnamed protein product [Adineta ricciae]
MNSLARERLNQHYCLNKRDCLELVYNAGIPLMIGVVSLWIAINQQKLDKSNHAQDIQLSNAERTQDRVIARLQRDEDRETARLQREEDKTMTRLQREEDQRTARLQREEDREAARLQRLEDKETVRLQRELDLKITIDKRIQDYELAELQRNMSEQQRAQELEIAHQNRINDLLLEDGRQKENVLLEYQDDLATLLLEYGSLFKDPKSKWWFILQMKTAAALRQLDPQRRTVLVNTLFDAGILDLERDRSQSLLYRTNLSGVEFGYLVGKIDLNLCTKYDYLNAAGADLRYASFQGVCLYDSPIFQFSNLDYTDWSNSIITNAYFQNDISMNAARFFRTQLTAVHFDKTVLMDGVSFQYNDICTHCQFVKTVLLNSRMDHSNFLDSKFVQLSMVGSNLSHGSFVQSTFQSVTFDGVDFSGAHLNRCTFCAVSMFYCSLSGTIFDRTRLSNVNMTGCTGLTSQQISGISHFYQTTLPNGTFIKGQQFSC